MLQGCPTVFSRLELRLQSPHLAPARFSHSSHHHYFVHALLSSRSLRLSVQPRSNVAGLDFLTPLYSRYMHHCIHAHLQPAQLLPTLLRTLRQTLFPNSSLPPPAPPAPSAGEISDAKRTCALSLLSLVPTAVCKRFFGGGGAEDWAGEVEGELDAWGDEYLNKHLGYAVLELIVIRLLPELGERRVGELLKERLGNDV